MKNRSVRTVKKTVVRTLLAICAAAMLLVAVAVGAIGIYVQKRFESEVPIEQFRQAISGSSPRFYWYRFSDRADRKGDAQELTSGVFAPSEKPYVAYGELPQRLIDAFVSIEDKRFYSHRGVDWYRTAAAGLTYVLGFSDSFGASTITQQTVKNVTGHSEVTLARKMQEILYALDLERMLDKSEILEVYLNVISFSNGCVGVGEAAQYYFSKEPSELTASECAAIAAITNNPAYYNPITHPENTLKRRNLILLQMREQGYLSNEEYETAAAEPMVLSLSEGVPSEEVRSWYTDMVIEDVINDLCEQYGMTRAMASMRVHSGGLRIEVAMDPAVQRIVEDYYEGVIRTPNNANGEHAQSAVIVLDSRTGDILGVAGAIGEKTANRVQNFATQTRRPPGSAIKPITVYAPALEKGIINWASVYDDVPINFGESGNQAWPKNATGVYRGLTNVAYSVAHSTNTVSVRVLNQLGLRESFRYAKEKFHLTSMIDTAHRSDCDLAALALGQLHYGVTLRELSAAYTVFADGGSYHPWRSYYRVTDADGNLLLSAPDSAERVLSEGNAAVMTKLLEGVIRDGTASTVTLDRITECAGKTGTTQNDGDRWFIGYTPDLICGVWCGYEYPEPIVGGNPCPKIWNDVMRQIFAAKGGRTRFEIPDNVLQMSYCRDSGKLMSDACLFDPRGERSQTGWFVKGTEPIEFCSCHVLCRADGGAGGISHGFCGEDHESRVALIRVERAFPMQIYVTDAQYVWRGDPRMIPPNERSDQAYFESGLQKPCGRSRTDLPFNRSCTVHRAEAPQTEETEAETPEKHRLDPFPRE